METKYYVVNCSARLCRGRVEVRKGQPFVKCPSCGNVIMIKWSGS